MPEWVFSEPIRTERVVLRPLEPSDASAVHAWMGDPEVARYQLYEPRTLEVVEEKVAEYAQARRLADKGDYIQPAIVVDGEVVGAMYLTIASVDDATAEIGWALRADRQGRGFATESAAALLDLCFGELGMHRVYAELDPRNTASVALCERLGMRHEAHFVEHMWFKGEWADTGVYAILDREWRGGPPPVE